MALPTSYPRERVKPQYATILVTLVPGSMGYDVELQRAPDSGGSPGTFATIAKLPPIPINGTVYRDMVPNDGVARWYRARHIRAGYTAGAWTTAASAVAPKLPRTISQQRPSLDPAPKRLLVAPRGLVYDDGRYGGVAVRTDGDRLRGWLVKSGDQTLSNDTETDITWETENADVGGLHSGSSKDITIPTAGAVGMWVFIANIVWEANATGIRELLIYQDPVGLSKAVIAHVRHSAASAGATAQTAVAVVNAPASGTVFYVAARQTSGGDLDVIGDQLGAGTRARGSYFHAIHVV